MQGGAGQGVHMPKPKFSIKTEVLGGGGVQWQRRRLRQTPPPLYCTADVILLSVPPGDYSPGRGGRHCTMWRYKRGRGPSSCPQGACKYCG